MVMVIVVSLLGLLVASVFFISRRQTKGTTKISKSQSIQKDLRTYTKTEVSKHNSRRDCWIIVKDKIYDVTPYVEEHPGGDAILNHAGGDSTEGFYGPQHATRVFDMIDEFYVGDLKRLKELIADTKQNGIGVVPALVKRMLKSNMLLFGSVDIAGGSSAHLLDEITKLNDKRLQIAQQKLFANTRIEDYLHMDLGVELDLGVIKKMSLEYTREKKLAVQAASGTVSVDDIKHIADDNRPVGGAVDDIVKQWDAQKDLFYKQTGVNPNESVPCGDFDRELEDLLTEE